MRLNSHWRLEHYAPEGSPFGGLGKAISPSIDGLMCYVFLVEARGSNETSNTAAGLFG
jgi:hypothetical protein